MRTDKYSLIFVLGILFGVATAAFAHGDPSPFQSQKDNASRLSHEVTFGSEQDAIAGLISVAQAKGGERQNRLSTYGQVVPSASAVSDVNAFISGEVRQVFVRAGDHVKAGQPLISIYNPEFIATQRGHLQLLRNDEKLNVLREEGRLPDYLRDAKENLKWWGMTDQEIQLLIEKNKVVEEIVLKSPADGFVTDVFVQPGLLVNAGDRSMKAFVVMGKSVARMILDKAPYWVEGSLFADQYALLKEGMKATVRLPDGRSIQRTVTQVLPGVDPKTQRGRFYIDLKQSVPGLVMGQPVKISVDMRLEEGMWVPRSAVLSQGFDPLVYVRLSKNRFSRRPVSINGEAGEFIRVTGVRQGEIVVTEGKMILEGLYRMSGQRDRHNGHDHNH